MFIVMESQSPPVSPRVVALIFISQKAAVIAGSFPAIACLACRRFLS
jgi:hypothetical protein